MSELTTQGALQQARRFAQFVRAFEHLEDVLETVAQAEQHVKEADKRRAKIQTDVEALGERAAAYRAQADEAIAQGKQAKAEAELEAEAIIGEATDTADEIESTHVVRLADLKKQITDAEEELLAVKNLLASETNKRDTLRQAIADMREKIAGLGGS